MMGWKPAWNEKHSESWNLMFHQILTECDIRGHYLDSNLPKCYKLGNTCGHLLHVELEDSASNTLQLTMLESVDNKSSPFSSQVASSFIYAFIFQNPVWDLAFQFTLAKTNSEKLFNHKKESSQKYSSTCVCPCSSCFAKWHERNQLLILPNFKQCDDTVFPDPITFLKHLHSNRNDYYHRVIMRQVQNLYSSLLAKFKILEWNTNHDPTITSATFQSLHKGKLTLPLYVLSRSVYETICVQRYVFFQSSGYASYYHFTN